MPQLKAAAAAAQAIAAPGPTAAAPDAAAPPVVAETLNVTPFPMKRQDARATSALFKSTNPIVKEQPAFRVT